MFFQTSNRLLAVALAGVLLSLVSCTSSNPLPMDAGQRPNIVFLMADDMGYGDPGSSHRESKMPTPQTDRLAAEGMRFTDAHSPSAVYSPTRYGVLTGRYARRSRLIVFGVLRVSTLSAFLGEARPAWIGKQQQERVAGKMVATGPQI